jgi:ParB family transcriptional regulator, chromosome partitioning protein
VAERGMGRGLAAILPVEGREDERLLQIPLDLIRPNRRQPRTSFDETGLTELATSITEHGVLQPVLVRPIPGAGYELIAGERRWRAARLAGVDRIPAVLRSSEDVEQLELALIENMAREDLNPVEAARACAALVEELGVTKEEIGSRVGRSRVSVSNLIRLLELPDDLLAMLERGELSEGHGRALLQARSADLQRGIARDIRDRGLSVREAEALARAASGAEVAVRRRERISAPAADAEAARRAAEDVLSSALGQDVRVRFARRGGRVEIPFEDLDEVHELARRLAGRLAA